MRLIVTGTGTGVGKTVVTAALAACAAVAAESTEVVAGAVPAIGFGTGFTKSACHV